MGLSLWLVPSPADSERLKRLMIPPTASSTLAPSYPTFEPHITLASLPPTVSSLDFILSSNLHVGAAIPLTCDGVEVGDHYFRSVYIAVGLSPVLRDLHSQVHQKLGIPPKTPKFPHMSLCYISDGDAAAGERDRFYQGLQHTGKIRNEGSSVSLNCGGFGEDWLSTFYCQEIWLVSCEGPVESWVVQQKIPLK
ncbi:cyclic phosphodiesterase [Favolaschia claudopus]|uniref:Cyclic phosphodiesterase n=1 Tax=Favolaschia claudopus TaxID=2862362 RepID=A0AAW0CE16_9AGAR